MAGALRLGGRTFAPGELVVMAIVNRTPDSFFDRGATFAADSALRGGRAGGGRGRGRSSTSAG